MLRHCCKPATRGNCIVIQKHDIISACGLNADIVAARKAKIVLVQNHCDILDILSIQFLEPISCPVNRSVVHKDQFIVRICRFAENRFGAQLIQLQIVVGQNDNADFRNSCPHHIGKGLIAMLPIVFPCKCSTLFRAGQCICAVQTSRYILQECLVIIGHIHVPIPERHQLRNLRCNNFFSCAEIFIKLDRIGRLDQIR